MTDIPRTYQAQPTPPTPTLKDELRALIARGLGVSECLTVFGEIQEKEEPKLAAYYEAAEESDELERDSSGIVSPGGDPGAWVLSWQWVSDRDAGVEDGDEDEDNICPGCGCPIGEEHAEDCEEDEEEED